MALSDTGAPHSLIMSRTVRQIRAFIDVSERGNVILGDNISTVNLLGTCSFERTIGNHTRTVKAYVIDANWGSSQQLVLGSDWLRENGAMLGEPENKGQQMMVDNQTIYAKNKTQPFVASERPIVKLSAYKFATFIESAGEGRKWTAINITADSVRHQGHERVPLDEYLSNTQYWEYSCAPHKPSLSSMNVELTTQPPYASQSDSRLQNPPDKQVQTNKPCTEG